MKKLILSAFATFACVSGFAQVTINANNLYTLNKGVRLSNDTLPVSATITPGGTGSQTWDFSKLTEDVFDSLLFVSPSLSTNSGLYPTANVSTLMQSAGNYEFFEGSSSDLRLLGQEVSFGGGSAIISSVPYEIKMKFPATWTATPMTFSNTCRHMADMDNSSLPAQAQGAIDSVRIRGTKTKTVTVDAYGPLTTPYGTYQTIRTVTDEHSVDTTYILVPAGSILITIGQVPGPGWQLLPPSLAAQAGLGSNPSDVTNKIYTWYTNDATIQYPVVEFTYNSSTVGTVKWTSKDAPVAGIKAISQNNFMVAYPNPASNYVNFAVKSDKNINATSVEFFDITGRKISEENIFNNTARIDLSTVSNGSYFYNLLNNKAEVIDRGKLNVVK